MTKTIKVALAGAGAFGIKHLDGIRNIDGVEVVSLISRELEKTREVAAKYGIGHVTTELADSLALKEVDAVILCTPTQMHAEQTLACLRAGKHVQVEIPLADSLKDARRSRRLAEADRPGGHVRPHPPLQPQPPVRAPADHGRQVQHPADGCADLLLPPHQHERAGPGAQLDRPPAVAPRGAHGGPVRLPVRQPDREGQRHPGADSPDAGHCDGHEHPAQGGQRRDLHAVSELQQRRPAGHLLPLHRRHRHLHRALRRPVQRQGRKDRREPGGRVA